MMFSDVLQLIFITTRCSHTSFWSCYCIILLYRGTHLLFICTWSCPTSSSAGPATIILYTPLLPKYTKQREIWNYGLQLWWCPTCFARRESEGNNQLREVELVVIFIYVRECSGTFSDLLYDWIYHQYYNLLFDNEIVLEADTDAELCSEFYEGLFEMDKPQRPLWTAEPWVPSRIIFILYGAEEFCITGCH